MLTSFVTSSAWFLLLSNAWGRRPTRHLAFRESSSLSVLSPRKNHTMFSNIATTTASCLDADPSNRLYRECEEEEMMLPRMEASNSRHPNWQQTRQTRFAAGVKRHRKRPTRARRNDLQPASALWTWEELMSTHNRGHRYGTQRPGAARGWKAKLQRTEPNKEYMRRIQKQASFPILLPPLVYRTKTGTSDLFSPLWLFLKLQMRPRAPGPSTKRWLPRTQTPLTQKASPPTTINSLLFHFHSPPSANWLQLPIKLRIWRFASWT